MKIQHRIIRWVALLALLTVSLQSSIVLAQGTAFAYHGRLNDSGLPANGSYDLQFTLYATAVNGSPVAGPVTNLATATTTNGLFTTTVDFGPAVFDGTEYWLDIAVCTNGAGAFTELTPRQQILPMPYAIFANTASNLSGTLSVGQLNGSVSLAQLPPGVVTNNETRVTLGGITVTSNLTLPSLTTTSGIIYAGGSLLLHGDTNQNFFVGVGAGNVTLTGGGNMGIGIGALAGDTSGNWNTANGYQALYSDADGTNNIALGHLAGYNITGGDNNIDIGNQGTSSDSGVIRIGGPQHATYIAGIYGSTASSGVGVYVNSFGQLGTSTSSRRFKQDIRPMSDASDVLLSLRPVTFRYKPEIDPQGIPQFGLVAEEVAQVDPDLIVRDQDGRPYSVRYEQVNAMLLNEFLKEHRKVEAQNTQIQALAQSMAELKATVEKLSQRQEVP